MATIDKDLLLEKIDRLLKLHSCAREDWFANTIHNTVRDAPEIETDGETIYRADAIEAVKDTMKRLVDDEPKGDSDTFTEYFGKLAKLTSINEEILKALSALPSAEAVQGEWDRMIADGSDGSHWYEYECSHCGEVVLRPYNFCPNCGAKMFREDGEV